MKKRKNESEVKVNIPIDVGFFTSLLGTTLLNKESEVSTVDALSDSRLIALYFSAHWCPPCRKFTPVSTMIASKIYDLFRNSQFNSSFFSFELVVV